MKKKTYSKPELSSEMFVPQSYVAACAPGSYVQGQMGQISSSWHGWKDSGPNGQPDKVFNANYDNQQVTSNNSGKTPAPGTQGIWVWDEDGINLYIAYQMQNDKQYAIYETTYIPKNNS